MSDKFLNKTGLEHFLSKCKEIFLPKTSGGIPKTDLASDVQTSLGKADSALQSHQDISGKENTSNKVTSVSSSSTDTQYPSAKAMYTALSGKANSSHTHTKSQITDFPTSMPASDVYDWAKASTKPTYAWSEITSKPSTFTPASHSHDAATQSYGGFMSSADKTKLDGITESADSVSFTRSLSSGTKIGTITINGTGTDLYAPTNTDTHYTAKNVVASSSTGTENVTAATSNPYLNLVENGTVRSTHRISGSGATTVKTDTSGNIIISSTGSEYGVATQSANGLMSSTDKTKLDGIATGADKTIVDSSLSSTSTNPVQNKVINTALSGKANSSHSHNAADITGLQSYVDGRIEAAMGDINAILDNINGEVV